MGESLHIERPSQKLKFSEERHIPQFERKLLELLGKMRPEKKISEYGIRCYEGTGKLGWQTLKLLQVSWCNMTVSILKYF